MKHYAVMFFIAIVAIAIVFRISQVKSVVVGA